jgi:hypothetical protein
LYNHWLYLLYWLINSLVIYLVKYLWPESLVLGSWRFAEIEAAIYAGFWMTFIFWLVWDFAKARNFKMDNWLATWFFFGIVNCVTVWAVTRFGFYLGFMTSSLSWILVIGLGTTLLQRLVWTLLVERRRHQWGF